MSKNVIAVASNLPIAELEKARKEFKVLAVLSGKKMRIRYRGPRYDSMRLTCLKKDARAFSVYFD
jgi:hypothetical protein